MNFNKEDKLEKSRRTRQSKTRSSPNSKLLNAAWPKAPSNPTRKSQIKTVNHEFAKSWGQWRQQAASASGECSIEDMDVDMDTDEEINAAKGKRPSPKGAPATTQSKSCTSISSGQSSHTSATKSTISAEDNRHMLKAKRTMESAQNVQTPSAGTTRRTTRSAKVPTEKEVLSDTSKKEVEPPKKTKENQALFIIIHVNKVEVGSITGRATTPIKVYADKFMIQIENEATQKDLSFRVPCKQIMSLKISLKEKPFFLKFTTKEIQYIQGMTPSRKSKGGQEPENVSLYLAYEETVPTDVQNDLRELFQVRLADKQLWPKDENLSTPKNDKKETSKHTPAETKNLGKEGKIEKEKDASADVLKTAIAKAPIPASVLSVRKRTPMKDTKKVTDADHSPTSKHQAKFARRNCTEMNDAVEERLKTLSHEAAHYQMITAQQRMIIQSLEEDIRQKNLLAERNEREIMQEKEDISKVLNDNDGLQNELMDRLDTQRALVKDLEEQLRSAQADLMSQERDIQEKVDALKVRDETIRQLRSTMRRYSTTEKETKKSSNEEETVPLSAMEETRQHLMQMQVSKENLVVELQLTKDDLAKKKSDVECLRGQLENTRRDLQNQNESVINLRTDLIRVQEDIVTKTEQVRSLTSQLSDLRRINNSATGELRNELSVTKLQLDEARCELNEAQTRLSENQELLNQQHTVSRDWILERGEINLSEDIIGVGAWGNVKVGHFRGTKVAVKQIHLLILSPHNRRLFEREMAIASRCRHPCLVQFIGATNDDGTPLFAMELLETDLRTVLSQEALENQDCLQLGFDVIRALNYLHLSKPVSIIHRDISSSNILMYGGKDCWRGKLSDYGAANFMRLSMTRHPGALLYSAPEASTMDQTPKLDVYSFGVLFCEMCTRELPVPEHRQEQVAMVTNADYKNLINNCLRRDVARRLDSTEVLQVFQRWIDERDKAKPSVQ